MYFFRKLVLCDISYLLYFSGVVMKTPAHINENCRNCSSRHHSVFAELQGDNLETLSSHKLCGFYKKGQIIFHEENFPTGLYCIRTGAVKLSKISANGKEQIVRLAGEGNVLGYRALIGGEAYASTAVVMEDSTICHVPRDTFFELITTDSHLSARIMRLLTSELKMAEARIVDLAHKSVKERLAETLLLLAEKFGTKEDGVTIDIRLTREDLANMIGTATESVIRLLSELQKTDLIELEGKAIKLINRKALIKLAGVMD